MLRSFSGRRGKGLVLYKYNFQWRKKGRKRGGFERLIGGVSGGGERREGKSSQICYTSGVMAAGAENDMMELKKGSRVRKQTGSQVNH